MLIKKDQGIPINTLGQIIRPTCLRWGKWRDNHLQGPCPGFSQRVWSPPSLRAHSIEKWLHLGWVWGRASGSCNQLSASPFHFS